MADDYPRPDLERMYKMRSSRGSGSGGGGGVRNKGCGVTVAALLTLPWLLDLLTSAAGRLT